MTEYCALQSSDHTAQPAAEAESTQRVRVAYVMSRFPKLTETFVLYEMCEMERLGVDVRVFPLRRERTKVVHDEARRFVEKANWTPWVSADVARAHFHFMCQSPLRYWLTAFWLIAANLGSLRYLTAALVLFPKIGLIARRMQEQNVQHVHAHFASHPAMAAWVIFRLTGIPYTFTAHGSDLHRDQHMLALKSGDAARVITISEFNKQFIQSHCPQIDEEQIEVVHCGIDLDRFETRTEPTAFERGVGLARVTCVGTLHEVKGQRFLLEACRRLQRQGVPFVCQLIGDGPDRQKLEQLTVELGLQRRIVFHGRRTSDEVQQLLHKSDVVVAPSVPTADGRREGIPVALMEAMAVGIPVVASRLSGIPELVWDGECGYLAEPGNAEELADHISRLLDDPSLRREMGLCARLRIEREFGLEANCEQLLEIMHSARPTSDVPRPVHRELEFVEGP